MRRLYVAPHPVWDIHRDFFHPLIGSHYVDLIAYSGDSTHYDLKHTDPSAWLALPAVQAWVTAGKPLLISTSLDHSEFCEDKWHGHPDVAILPHPTFEGTDQLKKHKDSVTKKIKQQHLDALTAIGVADTHTVWDVSDRASKIHPLCKLRAII